MPRKLRAPYSEGPVFKIPVTNDDEHLRLSARVTEILGDFSEFNFLEAGVMATLVDDLVRAIQFAQIGVPPKRKEGSARGWTLQIWMSDVRRALEDAGTGTPVWRRDPTLKGENAYESYYFRIARTLADEANLELPEDLYHFEQKGREVQHAF